MAAKKYFVETFGCQMNVNDSEKVAGLLAAEGYEAAEDPSRADFVFVNTCAVREKASEKLFHALGRLKGLKVQRPDLVIGVGGCVAQLEGRSILERAPQVDVLVGTHNLARVPELIEGARKGLGPSVDLDREADSFRIPPSHVAHSSAVRAYVTVMEGCNHVCSFCVVPRTRGPEVCRAPKDIVAEVRSLVDRGYPEVMLLGQTVNAYRYGSTEFADLLTAVHAVSGLRRLRFTTSHAAHVNPAMAAAFRDLARLCPYLHLPFQSGSNRVLESMRRGYTREEYLDTVALLRRHRPDLALSTDVIVGYPGETEEDFQATVDLVDEVGFEGLFVFEYSPRPRTTAHRLADDVPAPEKRRRLRFLNDRQQESQAVRNQRHVGGREEVLVEGRTEPGRVSGRTPHFRIVHVEGPASLQGRLVEAEITGAGPNSLRGRIDASSSLTVGSAAPIF
jgi:tRNA-2-methylthio-N6-dimethylallyladenosine synthase